MLGGTVFRLRETTTTLRRLPLIFPIAHPAIRQYSPVFTKKNTISRPLVTFISLRHRKSADGVFLANTDEPNVTQRGRKNVWRNTRAPLGRERLLG